MSAPFHEFSIYLPVTPAQAGMVERVMQELSDVDWSAATRARVAPYEDPALAGAVLLADAGDPALLFAEHPEQRAQCALLGTAYGELSAFFEADGAFDHYPPTMYNDLPAHLGFTAVSGAAHGLPGMTLEATGGWSQVAAISALTNALVRHFELPPVVFDWGVYASPTEMQPEYVGGFLCTGTGVPSEYPGMAEEELAAALDGTPGP